MNKSFLLLILLSLMSCGAASIKEKKTKNQIILGSIGQGGDYLLAQSYSNSAIPWYTTAIKVQAIEVPFKKSSYKRFLKAQLSQTDKVHIKYIDSIAIEPKYLNIEIVDRASLISLLNGKENEDIKQYLIHQNKSEIVTHISIAFTESILKDIEQAEEVFIELTGKKSIALHLYSKSKLIKVIGFFEGVVFKYQTARSCWKENNKYQLEIIDLVNDKSKCPGKSYLSSQKAKKKINYYKF